MKKKKFECQPRCEKQYVDEVIISCKNCIKHIAVPLSQTQKEMIALIIMDNKS